MFTYFKVYGPELIAEIICRQFVDVFKFDARYDSTNGFQPWIVQLETPGKPTENELRKYNRLIELVCKGELPRESDLEKQ